MIGAEHSSPVATTNSMNTSLGWPGVTAPRLIRAAIVVPTPTALHDPFGPSPPERTVRGGCNEDLVRRRTAERRGHDDPAHGPPHSIGCAWRGCGPGSRLFLPPSVELRLSAPKSPDGPRGAGSARVLRRGAEVRARPRSAPGSGAARRPDRGHSDPAGRAVVG